MAVRGSKSKNTKAKGTKGNPTRTKVKTKSIYPKTVSAFKNSLTKQVSQQSLKARAEGRTGTGVIERLGGITVKRNTNIFKPTLQATAKKGGTLRSAPRSVKKVVRKSK
jgi:hypothetical protein